MDPIDYVPSGMRELWEATPILQLIRLYEERGEMRTEEAEKWRERIAEWVIIKPRHTLVTVPDRASLGLVR